MKPVSLTLVLACALLASFSSRTASFNNFTLALDAPSTPFFERLSTLPAGKYQLTTSYAFSERSKEIRSVLSVPFLAIDNVNDQKFRSPLKA